MTEKVIIPEDVLQEGVKFFLARPSKLVFQCRGFKLSRNATLRWNGETDDLNKRILRCQDVQLHGSCLHEFPCDD